MFSDSEQRLAPLFHVPRLHPDSEWNASVSYPDKFSLSKKGFDRLTFCIDVIDGRPPPVFFPPRRTAQRRSAKSAHLALPWNTAPSTSFDRPQNSSPIPLPNPPDDDAASLRPARSVPHPQQGSFVSFRPPHNASIACELTTSL